MIAVGCDNPCRMQIEVNFFHQIACDMLCRDAHLYLLMMVQKIKYRKDYMQEYMRTSSPNQTQLSDQLNVIDLRQSTLQSNKILKECLEFALNLKRPYGGKGVDALAEYLLDLPNAFKDDFGNVHVPVGLSTTMFSSHIDTVHKEDGINPYKMIQREIDGEIRLRYRARAECLGADCAAGVALMVSMIHEGVNGYYVFHDGEEQGCLGSRFLAKEEVFLKQFRRAIAFDRKGSKTIITHQAGIETSSAVFANSLREELLIQGLDFELSDRGATTDVFHYRNVIAECTNLSVGYHFAHSPREWLEFGFLEKMTQACAKVQWEKLTLNLKKYWKDYKV